VPVSIVSGDLLSAKEDIIAHQVNCKGVMGAGVAKQIKKKWPEAYDEYACECEKASFMSELLLGEVVYSYIFERDMRDTYTIIAHMFGQDGYGKDNRCHTNYKALECAMENVADYARYTHKSIAMPHKIGCGLGGGDWNNVVLPMIHNIFDKTGVEVRLYKKE